MVKTKLQQHRPGGDCNSNAEREHEAHGVGGLVDGHGRQLSLGIRQQAAHHHRCLAGPPLRYQQHACHRIRVVTKIDVCNTTCGT